MTSIVGANNAGKSTILRAIDFLFNPSTSKLNEESFWAMDTGLSIWVEGWFTGLSAREAENFGPYLRPDDSLLIARSAVLSSAGEDYLEADQFSSKKFEISQHYSKPVPKIEWLNEAGITGAAIDGWWRDREKLVANGQSFAEFIGGSRPNVGEWKAKAAEFAQKHLTPQDYVETWIDNPQGYAGVLKARLPHFILVPAVRDVADETKATKSNPLGRLLYSILGSVTQDQHRALAESLAGFQTALNRSSGDQRITSIASTEQRLNELLQEYMDCDIEIEFQPPTLEVLLTTPKVYADDGFRNLVENKGHGLQRAVIFSILRCYSELVTGSGQDKARSMILGVEEPELYMHPQAQRNIRRVFQSIAEAGDQVVFSTHSGLLLDVAYFDQIVRLEAPPEQHNGRKTVQTRVWQISMDAMLEDLGSRHPKAEATASSIRELYANAYHPTRSEGFFAKRLILVEGPTEEYSLPIYALAMGMPLDTLNVAVIDCGGKGPMDRLYRIFNELGIPCYLVFDYDKESEKAENLAKSRELLQLVGLSPDPPADVIVTDRLACFPTKWETVLAIEIPEMVQLTTEARSHLGLTSDSGKPLIARFIAAKLVSQEPPIIPPSILRILEAALATEWRGSCLQMKTTTVSP